VSPFDPTTVRGTPFGAPLVPPLPLRLRRTEILTIVYETDGEAADALVPTPLRLTAPRAAAPGALDALVPGTLELRPNAQAPFHLVPVRRVELALHRIVDLTVPPGTVVHRYPEP